MQNLPGGSKTPITSSKCKSVFLREWWLIKVDKESKIGVGGFANKESLGTRGMRLLGSAATGKRYDVSTLEDGIQVFSSAAIAKRHDSNTLEAEDGIIIMISGCINKSRTLSHGFSTKVSNCFLSGFPYNWKDYATKYSHEKCANTENQSLPVSFDDLPVTRVRDLLISESRSRELTSIIFRDILKHTEKILDQSVSSIKKVCKSSTETEVDLNQDNVSLNPTQEMIEEDDKIPVDLQSGNSEETLEKQSVELSRKHTLRSTKKAKRI
ncbi:hypothetical protein R6Q59_011215 [Mikania micrantha]